MARRNKRRDGCGTLLLLVLLILIGIGIYGMFIEDGFGKINTTVPAYRDMYHTLNEQEQGFYDTLRAMSENGELTTSLPRAEEGTEVAETVDMEQALTAFCYDFPEFFWLTGNYTIEEGAEADTLTLECYELWKDATTRAEARDKLTKAAAKLARRATWKNDPAERLQFVHDRMVLRCNMDFDARNSNAKSEPAKQTARTAYDSLVLESAESFGFAKGFQMVMNMLNIHCGYAEGEADGEHAWNYVMLDGEYYWVDVTLDNPVLTGYSKAIYYDYLLIDDRDLEHTHSVNSLFEYPVCEGTDKNFFVANGSFLEEYDAEGAAKLIKKLAEDHQVISLRFAEEDALEEAIENLFDDKKIADILGRPDVKYEVNEDLYILRILNK